MCKGKGVWGRSKIPEEAEGGEAAEEFHRRAAKDRREKSFLI
jgi:hypothetical protein